jgi:hypothetical protein
MMSGVNESRLGVSRVWRFLALGTFKTYESGHMVYLGEQPARQFVQDLREFIRQPGAR